MILVGSRLHSSLRLHQTEQLYELKTSRCLVQKKNYLHKTLAAQLTHILKHSEHTSKILTLTKFKYLQHVLLTIGKMIKILAQNHSHNANAQKE